MARATNVANMVTERQIAGEMKIKETKTIITEKSGSNGECNNCVKKGHRAVDCWPKKKDKEDDVENLFVGGTLCG